VRAWSTDEYSSLAIGIDNEVYLSGDALYGDDLDPDPWGDYHSSIGEITRFTPSGQIVWTGFLYSQNNPAFLASAVDNKGNIYLGGDVGDSSDDFDPGLGVCNPVVIGLNYHPGFLAKYPSDLYW
jgi:hypothetical protein